MHNDISQRMQKIKYLKITRSKKIKNKKPLLINFKHLTIEIRQIKFQTPNEKDIKNRVIFFYWNHD